MVRAECVRCPWLLATILGIFLFSFLFLFLPPLFKTTEGVVVGFQGARTPIGASGIFSSSHISLHRMPFVFETYFEDQNWFLKLPLRSFHTLLITQLVTL
jgi:hypothetical protein